MLLKSIKIIKFTDFIAELTRYIRLYEMQLARLMESEAVNFYMKPEELDEFLEIMIRLLDSFLLEPGPHPRDGVPGAE